MEKYCRKCEHLLNGGDLVRATIISRYIALKSKAIYALDKPTACYFMEHLACNDPKGEFEDDSFIEE